MLRVFIVIVLFYGPWAWGQTPPLSKDAQMFWDWLIADPPRYKSPLSFFNPTKGDFFQWQVSVAYNPALNYSMPTRDFYSALDEFYHHPQVQQKIAKGQRFAQNLERELSELLAKKIQRETLELNPLEQILKALQRYQGNQGNQKQKSEAKRLSELEAERLALREMVEKYPNKRIQGVGDLQGHSTLALEFRQSKARYLNRDEMTAGRSFSQWKYYAENYLKNNLKKASEAFLLEFASLADSLQNFDLDDAFEMALIPLDDEGIPKIESVRSIDFETLFRDFSIEGNATEIAYNNTEISHITMNGHQTGYFHPKTNHSISSSGISKTGFFILEDTSARKYILSNHSTTLTTYYMSFEGMPKLIEKLKNEAHIYQNIDKDFLLKLKLLFHYQGLMLKNREILRTVRELERPSLTEAFFKISARKKLIEQHLKARTPLLATISQHDSFPYSSLHYLLFDGVEDGPHFWREKESASRYRSPFPKDTKLKTATSPCLGQAGCDLNQVAQKATSNHSRETKEKLMNEKKFVVKSKDGTTPPKYFVLADPENNFSHAHLAEPSGTLPAASLEQKSLIPIKPKANNTLVLPTPDLSQQTRGHSFATQTALNDIIVRPHGQKSALKRGRDFEVFRDPFTNAYFVALSDEMDFKQYDVDISFSLVAKEHPPLPDKVLRLNVKKMTPLIKKLEAAGFSALAKNLKEQAQHKTSLSIHHVIQIFVKNGNYSYDHVVKSSNQLIVDNAFSHYSHFIKNGRFCGQCSSANDLSTLFLSEYFQDDNDVQIRRHLSSLYKDSHVLAIGHQQTALIYKGQMGLVLDATPLERTPYDPLGDFIQEIGENIFDFLKKRNRPPLPPPDPRPVITNIPLEYIPSREKTIVSVPAKKIVPSFDFFLKDLQQQRRQLLSALKQVYPYGAKIPPDSPLAKAMQMLRLCEQYFLGELSSEQMYQRLGKIMGVKNISSDAGLVELLSSWFSKTYQNILKYQRQYSELSQRAQYKEVLSPILSEAFHSLERFFAEKAINIDWNSPILKIAPGGCLPKIKKMLN